MCVIWGLGLGVLNLGSGFSSSDGMGILCINRNGPFRKQNNISLCFPEIIMFLVTDKSKNVLESQVMH